MSTTASAADAAVSEEVQRVSEEVVAHRREIHRHPELAHQEHRTAAYAASHAGALGYAVRDSVGGTGVIADIEGAGSGPTVMLRADMDALPVTERRDGRAVISEVDGVMHACGHDGHVAMLLGAGAVLASLRERWRGRVRLCFQPAEEIAGGAMPMIEAGAMDGVDRVLGIHLWAQEQVGRVAVTPGVIFGSADLFNIDIKGQGGHGGMPHTTIDPVVAAAHVVAALQTVVSRETSPFAPAVVTIGSIAGGTAPNVIADSVRLGGTVRALDEVERARLLRRVAEVARDVARAHRAEAVFSHGGGCPPVISDAEVADVVRDAATATVGADHVDVAHPITVGDDVACFLQRAPGCYYLVGAGHPGAPAHHSADFDIDEACLPVGVESMTRAALALLA